MLVAKLFGDDHPPGLIFDPTDEELIMLYLLPRTRDQADALPGVIIDDDAAANTQPWKLFPVRGLPDDLPAFFYVRDNNEERPPHAPRGRRCDGGGSWKIQKRERKDAARHVLRVGGESIRWTKNKLKLSVGTGTTTGWVMQEYFVDDHPSLRVCRISFADRGEKRSRLQPDDSSVPGEPVTRRLRVVAAAADSGSANCTTTSLDHQKPGTADASEGQERRQSALGVAAMPNQEIQDSFSKIQEFTDALEDDEEPHVMEEHYQRKH